MRRSSALCVFCLLFVSYGSTVQRANAQNAPGLIDGYSFGGGLALYQGDLDRNPSNTLGKLLTTGNLHLMAGVDRATAGGRLSAELHYNRVVGINYSVSGRHNVVSLDVTYGRRIHSSPVYAFIGLGPAIVFSSYETLSPAAETFGFGNEGTGFDLTIPLGFAIQEHVRLSTRIALFDGLDGTDRLGGMDFLSNISIVYRFDMHR